MTAGPRRLRFRPAFQRTTLPGCANAGVNDAGANGPDCLPPGSSLRYRMRQKGKAPKTILIAVARQLFVILNAMLRARTPIALA
ncbi:hypothetical protein C7450_10438 [Chelatococcus asaccharovorans]|uniref:Transposase IS116/IS110/IS902 family protein n=1 Tax=Chelatococcus asaccharovorans TaxID=28210 RepID=A0A2V3UAS9_9HYPH|nr:hypothetical protein C7450_10438 [Chelatococcus asaccharovorans]